MSHPSNSKPNIILIMADDMGFSDIGCYGSEISTPNLDEMAKNGLQFSQMYNGARCCPTRASLLTGLYAHQAGIGHMTDTDDGVPSYRGFIGDDCVTIAEVLKSNGYRTGMSGKWHVGGFLPVDRTKWNKAGQAGYPTPLQRGFDRFYGTLAGGGNYYNPHTLMEDDDFIQVGAEEDFYYTDAISTKAVSMIREFHAEQSPFFLYVAYTAPHWPLHARPDDIAKYRGSYLQGWDKLRQRRFERMVERGLIDPGWPLSPRDEEAPAWDAVETKDWEDMRMAVYAAQVDRMDQGIGTIMAAVKELQLTENTLVFFLSDNGGCAEIFKEDTPEEDRVNIAPTRQGKRVHLGNTPNVKPGGEDTFMSYGMPWANASNTPFRRYKHWVHEGGIATPLIVHWPKAIKGKNQITHHPSHLIDIMATIVEVSGSSYPPANVKQGAIPPLEGVSLMPLFTGKEVPREKPLFWEHEGNCAVRLKEWKLVKKRGQPWELYNMQQDRTELNDLAALCPEKVKELENLYIDWCERVGVVDFPQLQQMRRERRRLVK